MRVANAQEISFHDEYCWSFRHTNHLLQLHWLTTAVIVVVWVIFSLFLAQRKKRIKSSCIPNTSKEPKGSSTEFSEYFGQVQFGFLGEHSVYVPNYSSTCLSFLWIAFISWIIIQVWSFIFSEFENNFNFSWGSDSKIHNRWNTS